MNLPLYCLASDDYCRDTVGCFLWDKSFREYKAAMAAGLARDCFQPGEVCLLALKKALHSTNGALERWAKRIASGLTDTDLLDAIGREFGEWHQGCEGPGYTAMRNPPRFWSGKQRADDGKTRKPDLQGQALAEAVRELLGIPLPDPVMPQAPWASLPMFAGGAR